jgi:hypothetical protein
MPDSRLAARLRDVSREAHALALEVERGQSSTPLADHCQHILEDFVQRAPALVVLATSRPALREALGWLLGPGPSGAVLRAGLSSGMTEIELEGEGYAVVTAHGLRQELPDREGFLGVILQGERTAPGHASRWEAHDGGHGHRSMDPSASGGQRALTLLVPESAEVALEQAGLLGELQSRAQVFVLAHDGPPHPYPPEQWGRVQQVLTGAMVLWPVAAGQAGPDGGAPARWWREFQGLCQTVLAPTPTRAVEPGSPLRGAIAPCLKHWALQAAAQRLRQAVAALKERLEHDLTQLQARRVREDDDARVDPMADAMQRRPFDAARLALSDELGGLAKLPAESSRRSLLPEGALNVALGEQLRRLEHADLEREPGARSVKLTLASVAQGQLVATLRRCLKEEIARDITAMAEALQSLQQRLEPMLEAAAGQPARLSLRAPDGAVLWSEISDMVAVDVRYRGEMPRRGFFQRLGEGRKAVFAGLMVLSLAGSFAGFSPRGAGLLGVAFLVVFVAVVVLTYRTWQQEDAERLDKELERVREQLLAECRRVTTDVQREKFARLGAHAEQLKRQVQLQIDELQRERQFRDQQQLAEQRERARRRREQIDRQLREAQQLASRMAKVVQDAQRLLDDATAEARETATQGKLLDLA